MKQTSLEAYEQIQPELSERQNQILEALTELEEATDYEIADHLGKTDPNYVRPRRHELVNDFKYVGFSQKRKCKMTGKTCLAWKRVK